MTGVKVALCGHDAALYAVKHWHYSESLPVPPRVTFGVWEDGKFIGTVIYSRGASPSLGRFLGLSQTESCELTRVALADHAAPVTQVVAESLRALKRDQPGIRAVISFADPYQGHHGGIYQAGNWVYVGDSEPSTMFYDKDGRKYHTRQVSSTGYRKQFGAVRRVPKISELREVKVPGKHKYVMPLDRKMRKVVQRLAKTPPAPSGGTAV